LRFFFIFKKFIKKTGVKYKGSKTKIGIFPSKLLAVWLEQESCSMDCFYYMRMMYPWWALLAKLLLSNHVSCGYKHKLDHWAQRFRIMFHVATNINLTTERNVFESCFMRLQTSFSMAKLFEGCKWPCRKGYNHGPHHIFFCWLDFSGDLFSNIHGIPLDCSAIFDHE
jgi:hypothetical protein